MDRLAENGREVGQGIGARVRYFLTAAARRMPQLYRLTLSPRGNAPEFVPRDPWIGDPENGKTVMSGVFRTAGQTVRQSRNPWGAIGTREPWLASMNGFGWLRDLRAVGGLEASQTAIRLVADWMDHQDPLIGSVDEVAWRADVVAARIKAILYGWNFLQVVGDNAFERRLQKSLYRQVRHLERVAAYERKGLSCLHTLGGLVIAQACLPGLRQKLDMTLAELDIATADVVLPDGGIRDRNPESALRVLMTLVEVRSALREAQHEMPHGLQASIDRIVPMVRYLRHGDGGLCLFNGSAESSPAFIDAVLVEADTRSRPPRRAPHLGIERMAIGKTTVFVDVAAPPPKGFDRQAHAGSLSFEMSSGKERVVVNCGALEGDDGGWDRALRGTAAHSTLMIDDTNVTELLASGGVGKRKPVVTADRDEDDGMIWLTTTCDGYGPSLGMQHIRRLYLGEEGSDFRGEDVLQCADEHEFAIRFHLHPKVQVSLLHNKTSALIRLPSGAGWRFRASGGEMSLEDSVYVGSGEMKRAQQIVLAGKCKPYETTVKWAFRKER